MLNKYHINKINQEYKAECNIYIRACCMQYLVDDDTCYLHCNTCNISYVSRIRSEVCRFI